MIRRFVQVLEIRLKLPVCRLSAANRPNKNDLVNSVPSGLSGATTSDKMRDIANSRFQAAALVKKAYLTEQELADRLSVSVKWLQKMRLAGGGIPFCKFGSTVRYPLDQVITFEAACLRASTSDSGA